MQSGSEASLCPHYFGPGQSKRHARATSLYVASPCYVNAMARTRISTTVDEALLAEARFAHPGDHDAALLDAALGALLARSRAALIDGGYRAYDEHPLDEPDEWGDLQSFRTAVASS